MPVGHILAAERRRQGRSLAEVERATKVMGRMLDALEHERWDELPAPVYVKGYIQSYAQFLGLDEAPLLEEYTRDVGKLTHRSAIERIPERTIVPHRREVHQLPRQTWIGLVVAVAVLALVLWVISSLGRRDESPPPVPVDTTTTVDATSTTPSGENTASLQPGLDAAPETSTVGFTFTVTVAQGTSSWVRVLVDGAKAYEGTLAGGTPREWTAEDRAVVRIGKPASVTITKDGQPVDVPLGGGIAEVTLTGGE